MEVGKAAQVTRCICRSVWHAAMSVRELFAVEADISGSPLKLTFVTTSKSERCQNVACRDSFQAAGTTVPVSLWKDLGSYSTLELRWLHRLMACQTILRRN